MTTPVGIPKEKWKGSLNSYGKILQNEKDEKEGVQIWYMGTQKHTQLKWFVLCWSQFWVTLWVWVFEER